MGANNSNYYIAQNASSGAQWWWTMSPDYWNSSSGSYILSVGGSSSNGYLNNNYVDYMGGVRPVISLKACVTATGGNGTASDPYIVGLPSTCSSVEN